MANPKADPSIYYVPHNSWYPVLVGLGVMLMLTGFASWLIDTNNGEEGSWIQAILGLAILCFVLFRWFEKVIDENFEGLANPMLKRSYVWGMGWFIFSEVMFFAAFFGALFYARVFAVSWLGGEGGKAITGEYLWPEFSSDWPVMQNPDNTLFQGPQQSMEAPAVSSWATYLPFINTVLLLASSVTVHFAHTAIKNKARGKLIAWLGVTILFGIAFLGLQVEEYLIAYNEMGLTLSSGIYGSTFFILTGFHGFHVTLGTVILIVQLLRAFKGHFQPDDCFGFEAASWYWHFVDVVWVCLFIFVYVL
ncbi:MAG: cytochrome c oxidase subunit 3 [Gammaproteobacteria bacterium]|nr:cytochrome c oxidase subunit 3 [Gammaproteobacteria bacterium]